MPKATQQAIDLLYKLLSFNPVNINFFFFSSFIFYHKLNNFLFFDIFQKN